jgi:hypothetical protein
MAGIYAQSSASVREDRVCAALEERFANHATGLCSATNDAYLGVDQITGHARSLNQRFVVGAYVTCAMDISLWCKSPRQNKSPGTFFRVIRRGVLNIMLGSNGKLSEHNKARYHQLDNLIKVQNKVLSGFIAINDPAGRREHEFCLNFGKLSRIKVDWDALRAFCGVLDGPANTAILAPVPRPEITIIVEDTTPLPVVGHWSPLGEVNRTNRTIVVMNRFRRIAYRALRLSQACKNPAIFRRIKMTTLKRGKEIVFKNGKYSMMPALVMIRPPAWVHSNW